MKKENTSSAKQLALIIGAIGVVYGDIGTSPLYAFNEIFYGHSGEHLNPENVIGSLSLIFWALTLIISIKYLVFVLRADNEGEGGVFALLAKFHHIKIGPIKYLKILIMLAAGLLIGEGIITPAISVLSAIEGIGVLQPALQSWILPLTTVVLAFLFFIQKSGTTKVGKFFGPIAIAWFFSIGFFGFLQIIDHLEVFAAINPLNGIYFLMNHGFHQSIIVLGSVMLVITGGEAVFADMGHFGIKPIRLGWVILVYPALLLSYFGQGAYAISGQTIANKNIFFSMIPSAFLLPMVILATCATVIASQALISGAFSLASQSIALGLFPRLKIEHTHEEHAGQIYVPVINFFLFIGSISLVYYFKTSTQLAAAYGLSVSGVMLTTSLSMIAIALTYWHWRWPKAFLIFGSFALIDLTFLTANSVKFFEGGFIPLSLGILIFIVIQVWKWGRKATAASYSAEATMKIRQLVDLKNQLPMTLDRNVVFMVPKTMKSLDDNVPVLIQFYLNRHLHIPKHMILVEVVHHKVPYLFENRYHSTEFYRDKEKGSILFVRLHFGFMEEPNVEKALEKLAHHHQIELSNDPHQWLVHVSHEYLIPSKKWNRLQKWRFKLFLFLRQITQPAYFYYGLGQDVSLSMDIMPVKLK